jgi:thiol-disulfide isomerase/thioredoxin
MKFFSIKNIALSLIFSLSIFGLLACSNASATKSDLNKSDFPLAPTGLMQANLNKLDGSTFKLADYKGKVILVNVWATWCRPCLQEIPHLIELQTNHQAKGFEVIGLNLDSSEDAELIKSFQSRMNINYQLARGEDKIFEEFYKVSNKDAIPQTFLISRDGRLLGVFIGGGKALQRLIESVNKVMAE